MRQVLNAARGRWKRIVVVVGLLGVVGLVCAVVLMALAHSRVVRNAQGRTFADPQHTPQRPVGLLLGTTPVLRDGRANLYFEYRLDAAVALFEAGVIERILVSGDNGTRGYDEPTAFAQRLLARGIPQDRIHLDFAGFRTLDSMVRAKEVFGQDTVLVISQQFHNERALYLADNVGLDAIAFNARDVQGLGGVRSKAREYLARVKVFVDLWFGVKPRFLGEPVKIPG